MIDMLRHFIGLASDTANANGNVIQSIREVLARLSPTRANNLDNLNMNLNTVIGPVNATGGTAVAGGANAKLNSIINRLEVLGVVVRVSVQRGIHSSAQFGLAANQLDVGGSVSSPVRNLVVWATVNLARTLNVPLLRNVSVHGAALQTNIPELFSAGAVMGYDVGINITRTGQQAHANVNATIDTGATGLGIVTRISNTASESFLTTSFNFRVTEFAWELTTFN